MPDIDKSDLLGDVTDPKGRIGQKFLGFCDADRVQMLGKALPGVAVQELAQMPLADVGVVGHFGERQLFCVVFLHVTYRLFDDEAACGILLRLSIMRAISNRLSCVGRSFSLSADKF